MILNHYSLSQPMVPLELHDNSTIMRFTKAKVDSPTKNRAIYVTTESYVDSDLAREMLSVTYYPKYVATIDGDANKGLQLVNNRNEALNSKTSNVTRVWPAFGKLGGSHELLITHPDKIAGVIGELANGGAPDMWHQDAVENYDPVTVTLIASAIISALAESPDAGFLPPDGESYSAKAVGNGLAINSSLKDKNVTLSAAWKNLTVVPEFKLWACLWRDYEEFSIRAILRPYSESVPLNTAFCSFPCVLNVQNCKEYLKWDLQYHGYAFSILAGTLRSLLRNITLVSDDYFKYHARKIVLPCLK